nr:hypothetical protein [Clostridium sp. Marseille-P7770]
MEFFAKIGEFILNPGIEANEVIKTLKKQGFTPLLYDEYSDGRQIYYLMKKV